MSLVIAIDYDDTYTADPKMWDAVIDKMFMYNHTVFIVTLRHEHEMMDIRAPLMLLVDDIFATGRKAKKPFVEAKGHKVDIWIDDHPEYINNDFGEVLKW